MNKQEYNNQYNRAAYTGISFRLSNRAEGELIDWIRSQDNAKEYICSLIIRDMKRRKKAEREMRNRENLYNQQFTWEVLEDLPYNDHYAVGYTNSFLEAVTILSHHSESQTGPLGIIERGYDYDLNCYYGIRRSSL